MLKKRFIYVFITLIFILILYIFIPYLTEDFSAFSQEKWDRYKYKRYLMIDDFEKRYDIKSMNRSQIKELLGDRGIVNLTNELTYVIGHTYSGLGFDRYYVLFFDENGRCSDSYNIVDTSNSYVGERAPKDIQ